ncbi:Tudor domain-containing protein 5, partial [Stegodyphus mimosarum]
MNMDLETVRKEIRSMLLTFQKGCSLTEFNRVYKDMLGCRLPFRDFSFQSDVEFLKSMPDVVSLRPDRSGDYLLKGIADEKSQHIQNLVCKQKPSKQKAPSRSRVISNSKLTSNFKTSAVSSSSLSSTVISKPSSNSRRTFSVPPRFNSLKKYTGKECMQEAVELVLSFPDGLRLSDFMCYFEKLYAKKFPFRSLGYATLDKCLESIPDLILEPIDNDTLIYHVSFIENTSRVQSDTLESFLIDRELMHEERN